MYGLIVSFQIEEVELAIHRQMLIGNLNIDNI